MTRKKKRKKKMALTSNENEEKEHGGIVFPHNQVFLYKRRKASLERVSKLEPLLRHLQELTWIPLKEGSNIVVVDFKNKDGEVDDNKINNFLRAVCLSMIEVFKVEDPLLLEISENDDIVWMSIDRLLTKK